MSSTTMIYKHIIHIIQRNKCNLPQSHAILPYGKPAKKYKDVSKKAIWKRKKDPIHWISSENNGELKTIRRQ